MSESNECTAWSLNLLIVFLDECVKLIIHIFNLFEFTGSNKSTSLLHFSNELSISVTKLHESNFAFIVITIIIFVNFFQSNNLCFKLLDDMLIKGDV